MTAYFQNGADEGTVTVYPNSEVGETIEEFIYSCGFGSAYPCRPVNEIDIETLHEDEEDYFYNEVINTAPVSDEDVEAIMAIIERAYNEEDEDDEDEDYDPEAAVYDIYDILIPYTVFP